MDEIIFRQQDAAKPLTGKAFILNIALIILKLAIAQFVINLVIALTGAGLVNIAFYLYAIWLLFGFMRRTVACYVYTLKESVLVLERRLGDSPITVIEIPLDRVISLRPVKNGERLKTTYRQVTEVDPACRPPFRVRAAFLVSLISGRLARRCAGKGVEENAGYVLVFKEGERLNACVFNPNAEMLETLSQRLGEAYGFDERMTRARVATVYGRALSRAFPALYPYVEPLIPEKQAEWATEELARRKEARAKKKRKKLAQQQKKTKDAQEPEQDAPQAENCRKQG